MLSRCIGVYTDASCGRRYGGITGRTVPLTPGSLLAIPVALGYLSIGTLTPRSLAVSMAIS